MAGKTDVLRVLESVKQLPTLPVVIQRLRAATLDPNSDAARIAAIIQDDPSIMTRVLKVVNSAFYGGAERISSLPLAIARLGFNAVHNIALSTSVFSVFPKTGEVELSREQFWRHSICTGIGVSILYERVKHRLEHRYTRDFLHLCGLLHDVGKVVLEQYLHQEFALALQRSTSQRLPLYATEAVGLTADHAAVGAWLGLKWNLAQELLQVIRWHHNPDGADVEFREVVTLCHVANYITNLEKLGDGGDTTAPVLQQALWSRLGLTVADIPAIVDEIVAESAKSEILMAFV